MESMEHGRVIDSNPFVDIATHLFLEDLASKVGVAGLNNYLISLANNLAANMPEEEYETWDEFLDALKNGHSILSSFEDVHAVTKHCVVTRRSPFERGWREYAKRVGAFSKVHREVAEYYNAKVKSTAVNSLHIILQTFRDAASKRIKVGGKTLRYEQIATVWVDGERKVAGDDRLPGLLKRAGISRIRLGMLLRNNADVWLLATD
ncbi:MAG: hypothetical protein E6K16_07590 [Methanobacteriota archaeon]|nr:MAG: hypothetical protein E6K16_07590 [Euryarchaeota archaeon]